VGLIFGREAILVGLFQRLLRRRGTSGCRRRCRLGLLLRWLGRLGRGCFDGGSLILGEVRDRRDRAFA